MKVEGSAHVEHAEYNEQKRELSITFRGGRIYDYQNVPLEKWQGFQMAESKGQYLHMNVIPHHRVWMRPNRSSNSKNNASE